MSRPADIEQVIEYYENGKQKYSIVYARKTVITAVLPQTVKDFIASAKWTVRKGVHGAEKVYKRR